MVDTNVPLESRPRMRKADTGTLLTGSVLPPPQVTESSVLSFIQGHRMISVSGFSAATVLNLLCYPFGSECFGTHLTFGTARVTTRNLLLKCIALMGIGALLGCALRVSALAAQPDARDNGTDSTNTSAPGQNPQGKGGIDYEHAKPMPLPSIPGPAPSQIPPVPPSTGRVPGPPGMSPGNTGTGEQNPQVLVPPKPLPETNPPNVQH